MAQMTFPHETLGSCDLVVAGTYLSRPSGALGGEPINRLLHCGNQGGIRTRGKVGARRLVVLYTTFADADWPDSIDGATGRFVYYGDNKKPGCELHATPKGGNTVLRETFEALHAEPDRRTDVPPFFVFSRTGHSRDVRFEGLAAPGSPGIPETEDLVAIWKTKGAERFQNYRAVFTILNAPRIARPWVDDVVAGRGHLGQGTPDAWHEWVAAGRYTALKQPQ